MSGRQTLSEEQRQQAIVKLLAERRAREQAQPSAAHAATLSDNDRARKVQQLLRERAAAKAGAHEQQFAGEDLLSPSSTCSLQSQRHEQQPYAPMLQHIEEAAPPGRARQHQQQHHQQHHQQQQHQPLQALLDGPVDVGGLWGELSQASSLDQEPSYSGQAMRQQQQQLQHHMPASQQQARTPRGTQLQPSQQHRRQPKQQQQQQLDAAPSQQRRLSPAASPEQRIWQLAQPKSSAANQHKYEQMRLEAELALMQHCSFSPATGRGPQHRQLGAQGLPAAERLYQAHAQRQARLERRLAEAATAAVEGCSFRPATNAAANERHLGGYEYVPLPQRLGQVLRSKNEKLAALQAALEQEAAGDATFAPAINRRSAALARRRSSRAASPSDAAAAAGGGGDQRQQLQDSRSGSVDRSGSRTRGLRKSRSEADLLSREADCSFSPKINSSSRAILQASGDIPTGFLARQQHFERLAKEKKQLLQLAVEEQHCSFTPAPQPSPRGCSGSGGGGSGELSYLERLERLAYQDQRTAQAARAALAQQVHSAECSFSPAINPRSRRMVQATPLQELYENSKGKLRRGRVAAAAEQQQQQECTFAPNLSKQGPHAAAPPQAKLSLSSTEVGELVDRLTAGQRRRDEAAGAAISLQQYQELKQCTFTPQITRTVPTQQEAVLVRGLGRFMELKAMARQQQQERAATEARVFKTHPQGSRAPFTVPQPFQLGRQQPGGGQQQRHAEAAAAAAEASARECTFAPAISSSHRSRQDRVKQLLLESEG